jgi:hypothetical protein
MGPDSPRLTPGLLRHRGASVVALSEPVIALVGVAIGAVLSAASALTAPWVTSALARRRFREELEWRRLDELAALMDDAALALERFHWSLRSAIDEIDHCRDEPKRWERHEKAVNDARDSASSSGSRLAIRLGPRDESQLVGVYDDFQTAYRALAETMFNRATDLPDARRHRDELDKWANHDPYFVAAKGKREELGQQLVAGVRSPSQGCIRQLRSRFTARG